MILSKKSHPLYKYSRMSQRGELLSGVDPVFASRMPSLPKRSVATTTMMDVDASEQGRTAVSNSTDASPSMSWTERVEDANVVVECCRLSEWRTIFS